MSDSILIVPRFYKIPALPGFLSHMVPRRGTSSGINPLRNPPSGGRASATPKGPLSVGGGVATPEGEAQRNSLCDFSSFQALLEKSIFDQNFDLKSPRDSPMFLHWTSNSGPRTPTTTSQSPHTAQKTYKHIHYRPFPTSWCDFRPF